MSLTRQTLAQMAQSIMRHTGGQVGFMEVVDAIHRANVEIHTSYEWPWTRAESNILIQPPYNTGTVSCLDNSINVTLTGGTWDETWENKRIYMGSNNVDLQISSITSPTALALRQPIDFGYDVVDQPYTIYQDMYVLPDDCEFGSILLVLNPLYRYRLRYLPVYTLETQNVFSRVFFTNFQAAFSDGGMTIDNDSLIRLTPAPSAAGEYRLIYRRTPPDMLDNQPHFTHNTPSLLGQSVIPASFDRCVEMLAEYFVRFYQPTPLPGWMECRQQAYELIQNMKRRMAMSLVDNAAYSTYPFFENSSIYADGLFVGVTNG